MVRERINQFAPLTLAVPAIDASPEGGAVQAPAGRPASRP